MASINKVLERVARLRNDALDAQTKADWLLELDGKLYREVMLTHEGYVPVPPSSYPEDGDMELVVGAPYDNLYDLYLMTMLDFANREISNYNNSAQLFAQALDEWKKYWHRNHAPKGEALINIM